MAACCSNEHVYVLGRSSCDEDWQLKHDIAAHTDWVEQTRLSLDSTVAASVSQDCLLRVWSVSSGERLAQFDQADAALWALAMGRTKASESIMLTGGADRVIGQYDAGRLALVRQLPEHHRSAISSLCISQTGNLFLSGSSPPSAECVMWDRRSRLPIITLPSHTGAVSGVSIVEDRSLAFSCSWDKTIRVMDVRGGSGSGHGDKLTIQVLRGHSGCVMDLDVVEDGSGRVNLLSGSADKTVGDWREK